MAANTLIVTASATFQVGGVTRLTEGKTAFSVSIGGSTEAYLYFPTSNVEAAIPLGGVVPRWAYFENTDATNQITIKAANGGQKIATLLAGEFALLPLDSSITAPTAIANAGTPVLKYVLLPN